MSYNTLSICYQHHLLIHTLSIPSIHYSYHSLIHTLSIPSIHYPYHSLIHTLSIQFIHYPYHSLIHTLSIQFINSYTFYAFRSPEHIYATERLYMRRPALLLDSDQNILASTINNVSDRFWLSVC